MSSSEDLQLLLTNAYYKALNTKHNQNSWGGNMVFHLNWQPIRGHPDFASWILQTRSTLDDRRGTDLPFAALLWDGGSLAYVYCVGKQQILKSLEARGLNYF